jgi:glucan phosphoethanolaminetransferase (alkaline phosphatase superfamily)
MLDNQNEIVIPVLGIIFLASLGAVLFQHFTKVSLGVLGIISWIIVICAAICFVIMTIGKVVAACY